jgi:hypothetical protein
MLFLLSFWHILQLIDAWLVLSWPGRLLIFCFLAALMLNGSCQQTLSNQTPSVLMDVPGSHGFLMGSLR